MKLFNLVAGLLLILFSLYFYLMHSDVFRRLFKRGFRSDQLGELLLPTILLVIGIVLLYVSHKKKQISKSST